MGVLRAGALPGLHMQPTAQVIDGSLKFERRSSNYLSRTFSAGNRKTFTVSFWHKHSNHSEGASVGAGGGKIFSTGTVGAGARGEFGFNGVTNGSNEDKVSIGFNATGSSWKSLTSDPFFRDFSAWQHFVIAVDVTQSNASDRVRFYVNGVQQSLSGSYPNNENQQFNNNVGHAIGRYNPEGTDYYSGLLSNFYHIDGLALGPGYFGFTDPLTGTWRPKKFRAVGTTINDGTVWSGGIPGNVLSGYPATQGFDGNTSTFVYADNSSTMTWTAPKKIEGQLIEIYAYAGNTHPILKVNGKSTGAVVGGTAQQNVWVDVTHLCPGGNLETIQAFGQNIGGVDRSSGWSAVRVDGVTLIDSTTTNLAFGTNGFYLPMDNEDDFEIDKSGKGNNWSKNNFSGTFNDPDVVKDSPSGAVFGGRGQTGITTTSSAPANYATLNPLNINDMGGTTSVTISDGNLTVANARNTYFGTALSTLSMTSGKYYCEGTVDSNDATTLLCGILKIDPLESRWNTDDEQIGYFQYGYGYRSNNGNKENNLSNSSYGSSYGDGDTIGIALDLDAKTISFYKNGTGQGVAYSGIPAGQYAFGFSCSETNNKWKANFGQKPFKYAPPQGYLPLNSATARPETVFARPDQYVGITTYSGNSATNNIRLGFAPDMIWLKSRTNGTYSALSDTVRGANYFLTPTNTEAERGPGYNDDIVSFDKLGFTLGADTYYAAVNQTGQDYVGWTWKAGGSKNTFNVDDVGYASAAAAGLTAGDTTIAGASVGTKQGFSIIKYTGPNDTSAHEVAHGLSQAPDFIITKNLDTTYNWDIYHSALGDNEYLIFTTAGTDSGRFSGRPTSTVFKTAHDYSTNENQDYIAYCWHDVPGLQKFGSYEGNGASDGPFVELGFKPAFLIIKNVDSSGTSRNWAFVDSNRSYANVANHTLSANLASAESAYGSGASVFGANNKIDLLSNGFKPRENAIFHNTDGETYVYMAWAEAPASNLFGGQSTGR